MSARTCSVEECFGPVLARGWCSRHYQRWKRHGDPEKTLQPGRTMIDGYLFELRPEHPLAMRRGYVAVHRLVAWDAGLFTDPTMHVHHVDGDRTNNSLDNLRAMTRADHAREHHPLLAFEKGTRAQ